MSSNEKDKREACWIYILDTGHKVRYIGLTGNLYQRMELYRPGSNKPEAGENARLVYYQLFPDTLTAIGFKLLLQRLSHGSVEYIIDRMNPQRENLITHININKHD